MKDLLNLVYEDTEINSDQVKILGSDMTQLLGLFYDIAEIEASRHQHEIERLQKYQIAYQKRLKKDKKREAAGEGQKQLKDEINKLKEELQKTKTQTSKHGDEISLLLEDIEDKERQIKDLKIDLKHISSKNQNLEMAQEKAIEEADLRTSEA